MAERYRAVVIRPLLRGQRQMIHNSLSPLNVVLGDRPRFIDWETMADAAPEFDVAELLRYPAVGLTWRETDALVGGLFGAAIDGERLRLAALSRAIDYAGANAQQWRRSQQQGDDAFAGLAYRRLRWYLAEAAVLTNQLRLESVMADILRDPGT